jgi:membrane protein YdbS with pleckstrin-like domain
MLTEHDERICLDSRRHGIVLARPLAQAAALGVLGGTALMGGWPLPIVGAGCLAVAAIVLLVAVWQWERTHVVVTTQKLYVVHGTLRRRATAVRLSRVGAIGLDQTLLGRLTGYGTLVAGELEIDFVPEPRRVCGLVARLGA